MDEAREDLLFELTDALAASELPEAEWPALLERLCPQDPQLRAEALARARESNAPEERTTPAFGVTTPPDGDPLVGTVVNDRYQVNALHSRGGMGLVYRATLIAESVRKPVAIKVMPRGMNTDAWIHRFHREREIQARLQHPSIVTLFDVGALHDGRPYYVMEWIDQGLPLDRYCEQHNLDLHARLALFQRVCEAVHYAHQQNVVHRDLKPGNILVTPEGRPKLLDFGLAKLHRDDGPGTLTLGPERFGTPDYMSPEQVDARPTTPQSDQYSLGIILFELLTGRSPYDLREVSWRAVEQAIKDTDIPRPSRILAQPPSAEAGRQPAITARQLRGDLDDIVLTALRKEPEARYPSVEHLREDLERWRNHKPISARAPSIAYVTARFLRRHRTWVAAAALVVVTSTGVTVIQARASRSEAVQKRIADEQKQVATQERQRAAAQARLAAQERDRANDQTVLTEQQKLVAGAVTFQMAVRALEIGDPQEAWRLATRYQAAAHYVVDDVSRSEMMRLAIEFTPESKSESLYGELARQRRPTTGSVDPSGAHRSVIDETGWHLMTRTGVEIARIDHVDEDHAINRRGEVVTSLADAIEARWLSSSRLIITVGGTVRTFDVGARRLSAPIAPLAGAFGLVVGSAGVLAAVKEESVVLFDYQAMKVVGTVERRVGSLAFSHGGRKIALLTREEELEIYLLVATDDGDDVDERADDDAADAEPADAEAARESWGVDLLGVARAPAPVGEADEDGIDHVLEDGVMFSRDDSMLLVSGFNARLVAASSLAPLMQFGYTARVEATFFGRDDRIALLVLEDEESVTLYSKTGLGSRRAFSSRAEAGAFARDGEHLVLAGPDGLKVLDLSGKVTRTLGTAGRTGPWSIATSSRTDDIVVLEGRRLSRWSLTGAAPIWSIEVGDTSFRSGFSAGWSARNDAALGPVWSADGKWIALKSGDDVILLDVVNGRTQDRIQKLGVLYETIRFSSDSKQLVLGKFFSTNGSGTENFEESSYGVSDLGQLRPPEREERNVPVWDGIARRTPQRSKEMAESLNGLRGGSGSVPIPADRNGCLRVDKRTADRSINSAVAITDRDSLRRLITLEGFDATPNLVALHPDSRFALTIGDGRAVVWTLGLSPDATACRAPQ